MRILCITDQFENSNHSSVEGIFGRHMRRICDVAIVYFSRTSGGVSVDGSNMVLPYSYKRHDICSAINGHFPLKDFDIVIIRNFFPVLRSVLKGRVEYGYRVGFWNSFPHSFRRLFEAKTERRAVFRKTLEYKMRSFFEKALVRKCDFLIVMSEEFRETFYGDVDIGHFCLPMGVDFTDLPSAEPKSGAMKRFIYTGTADSLRQTGLIAEAMAELREDFVLDIFTYSSNETTRRIKDMGDRRIKIRPGLPRQELFREMAGYDAGIGLVPENMLYRCSSPTKTLEYYSVGLPALINYLPEYTSLFDDGSAFFCAFTKEAVKRKMEEILRLPKTRFLEMGLEGRKTVKGQRDYKILSARLYDFLRRELYENGVV